MFKSLIQVPAKADIWGINVNKPIVVTFANRQNK